MHDSCMRWLTDTIRLEDVAGLDVLEVGSLNVNGSVRQVIEPFGPKRYVGVDSSRGPGVDVVGSAMKLVKQFGPGSFDVVVSTEMLEHVRDWRAILRELRGVLKDGGLLILTARGPGFPYHAFPEDHWRFTVPLMKRAFADYRIELCENDEEPGVLVRARKDAALPPAVLEGLQALAMLQPRGAVVARARPAAPPAPVPKKRRRGRAGGWGRSRNRHSSGSKIRRS